MSIDINQYIMQYYKIQATKYYMAENKLKTSLYQKKYKAVIFDFHFTLAHFYPSREKIYKSVIKKYGFSKSSKNITEAFSKTWIEYIEMDLINAFTVQTNKTLMEMWWSEFHSKVFYKLGIKDKTIIKSISKDIATIIYNDSSVYRIYPDVLKTLSFLKKHGIKIGIITNAHKTIGKIIYDLGLMDYFNQITISCEVGLSKPDPDIFKYTFRKMGVKVKDVLFVGDSYHTDVIGSMSSGCDMVFINRKDKSGKRQNIYSCINNLYEIKKII